MLVYGIQEAVSRLHYNSTNPNQKARRYRKQMLWLFGFKRMVN